MLTQNKNGTAVKRTISAKCQCLLTMCSDFIFCCYFFFFYLTPSSGTDSLQNVAVLEQLPLVLVLGLLLLLLQIGSQRRVIPTGSPQEDQTLVTRKSTFQNSHFKTRVIKTKGKEKCGDPVTDDRTSQWYARRDSIKSLFCVVCSYCP